MRLSFKVLAPLVTTFIILVVLIFCAAMFFTNNTINYQVLHGANLIFFLISLFVFNMQYKAMFNANPNVFIRSVMGGTIIKLFGCLIAIVAYYFLSGAAFNKPAVYTSMIFYVIYLVVEVKTIMKLNKTKNA